MEVSTAQRISPKKPEQLMVLFRNLTMETKMSTELIADCHKGTQVNVVTTLEVYSIDGSLESPLLNLKQPDVMVTAISVNAFPGVLQNEKTYIGR